MLAITRTHTYTSLREYRDYKETTLALLDQCRKWNKSMAKIVRRYAQNRRQISLLEHSLLADQLRLIGSCVKTDHYKDFYEAKSYLSLGREVSIKTQETVDALLSLLKQRDALD